MLHVVLLTVYSKIFQSMLMIMDQDPILSVSARNLITVE